MGQTLSEPIREKHSFSGGDERHVYGASEMQGWRINMEDAHSMILRLENDPVSFFAVYDGHGGASAAKYAGENVYKRLASEETYKAKDFTAALKAAYLGADEDLRSDSNFFRDPSGCTAVSALITEDNKIYVANAGDSRAVMSIKGEVKPLSFDHKPQNEIESARIKAAGGYVEYGRVNGNLALSRALGDFEFKGNTGLPPEQQIVTCDPEITVHEATEEDEFVVIACDGIWDCLTSQQVVDMTRRLIAERKELKEICEIIMDRCLAPDSDINGGVGCDNMTVIVIALLRGRTQEEWYDWVADRVEKGVGYETPKELPQLYSASRLAAAKDRWGAPGNRFGGGSLSRPGSAGFGTLARVFGSNVMFHPSGGISNNYLAFEHDDSSEEYESEGEGGEQNAAHKAAGNSNYHGSLVAPPSKNPNDALRRELEAFQDEDEDIESGDKKWTIDDDGDSQMKDSDTANANDDVQTATTALNKSVLFNRRTGKPSKDGEDGGEDEESTSQDDSKIPVGLSAAPPTSIGSPLVPSPASISTPKVEATSPPKVNGTSEPTDPVEQLKPTPDGDKASDAAKVEGLMDKSEDPIVVK